MSESGRPTTSRSKISAAVLPQSQTLGEEEEVELASLCGLGEMDERREVGLAARRRVAPHRRVVDAGEVCGEVDLLERASVAPRPVDGVRSSSRSRGCVPVAGRSSPKRSRSVCPRGRAAMRSVSPPSTGIRSPNASRPSASDDGRSRNPSTCRSANQPASVGGVGRASSRHRVARPPHRAASSGVASGADRQRRDFVDVVRGRMSASARVDEHDVGAPSGERRAHGSSASTATIGWPCGGRGVIDGPRTSKKRPSKST